ncbi:uncharacterized protein LOC126234467 [Schistocerca nitens]|uniref:uncharacterized protein LOC126234467 n=1 Tax=Schistocerca nitens TaxID=7011 RepID=UPI002117B449|nr:uncharacterized protein LOC126234467 [Schistocerca nitens]
MTEASLENVVYYRGGGGYASLLRLPQKGAMHGARRVATFCLLTAVLPTVLLVIPLYLRHSVFSDRMFEVAEDEILVLETVEGISTVFCQGHSLKMNSTFNAFQLRTVPEIGTKMKSSKIIKKFSLHDDTWEYWGFFLPKGSAINVTLCSSNPGARMLIVKGDKTLKKCDLIDQGVRKVSDRILVDRFYNKGITVYEINKQQQSLTEKGHGVPQHDTHIQSMSEQSAEQFEGEDETDDGGDYPLSFSKGTNRVILPVLPKQLKQNIEKIPNLDEVKQSDTGNSDDDSLGAEEVQALEVIRSHLQKHANDSLYLTSLNQSNDTSANSSRKMRHAKSRARNLRRKEVSVAGDEGQYQRQRRDVHALDGGMAHGGTAANYTEPEDDGESSESSFENELLRCYGKHTVFEHDLVPSQNCTKGASNMTYTTIVDYKVQEDGYYHYIFYSDNDFVDNTINAVFEMFKPRFKYTNYTHACINQTECHFDLSFWSNEVVILEMPHYSAIETERKFYLISSCYPRMAVYVVFPISVLFLILGCAFL